MPTKKPTGDKPNKNPPREGSTPYVTQGPDGMGKRCCSANPGNWNTTNTNTNQNWNASQNPNWQASPPPSWGTQNPYRAEFASENIILDDPSMIQDVLSTQKMLIRNYGFAICEGSNQKLRHMCGNHLSEVAEDQFDAFKYMQSHNWYPVEPAPEQKLSAAKEKFKSKEEGMNVCKPR